MRRPSSAMICVALGGCAADRAPDRVPVALPSPQPEAPPGSARPDAPGATPSAPRPAASLEAEPPERAPPPRTGLPGSTRGAIACGPRWCAAPAEGCVWDRSAFEWRCQAPDAPLPEGPDVGVAFLACDDGTDCPQGQTCCNPWGDHFSGATRCVPRAEVNATCASELCMERTAGGARCPPGRTCEGATATEPGACVAPVGPATCAGRRPCPPSAPICVEGPSGLACVAEGSPAWRAVRGDRRYRCTLPSDCHAGDTCAYVFGEIEHDEATYCGKWHPAYQGSLVCEVGKLDPCGSDAECRARMTCHPSKRGPPWMGVWGSK